MNYSQLEADDRGWDKLEAKGRYVPEHPDRMCNVKLTSAKVFEW